MMCTFEYLTDTAWITRILEEGKHSASKPACDNDPALSPLLREAISKMLKEREESQSSN